MVREDKSLLDGFSSAEEAEMVKEALKKRALKKRGARSNNLASAADARRTINGIADEVRRLCSPEHLLKPS